MFVRFECKWWLFIDCLYLWNPKLKRFSIWTSNVLKNAWKFQVGTLQRLTLTAVFIIMDTAAITIGSSGSLVTIRKLHSPSLVVNLELLSYRQITSKWRSPVFVFLMIPETDLAEGISVRGSKYESWAIRAATGYSISYSTLWFSRLVHSLARGPLEIC